LTSESPASVAGRGWRKSIRHDQQSSESAPSPIGWKNDPLRVSKENRIHAIDWLLTHKSVDIVSPALMSSPSSHPRDPLHGITLENIINQLVQKYGWSEMGRRIPVRCFQFNPTVKSSLTFLRKTPWARKKLEDWFISELPQK
jgi:hypothetical protein